MARAPRRGAGAANELLGLACRAVETQALSLPAGKTHTHYKRLFTYTCSTHPRLSLFPFPMHMFPTWLWRKCLNRSCSKTDAHSVVFASGGLFASEGVANVVFWWIVLALDSVKHERERGGKAFVNGRQLKCESVVLGIERRNRWR